VCPFSTGVCVCRWGVVQGLVGVVAVVAVAVAVDVDVAVVGVCVVDDDDDDDDDDGGHGGGGIEWVYIECTYAGTDGTHARCVP
jgi:hypothetical protein